MRRDVGSTKPASLGVAAFIIAIVAVTVGAVLMFIGGLISGPLSEFIDRTSDIPPDYATLPAEAIAIVDRATPWTFAGQTVFQILAIWAGIQGVAAFVTRRGRRWGLLAIGVAIIGYFVVTSALQYGATFTEVPFGG